LPFENKKQLLIIGGAVLAGIIAVFLMSNYVKSSVDNQTAVLAEQFNAKQKEMASELQQHSEQQIAQVAQQIERVRQEDAAAMQKQMVALQQAQQQAQQAQQAAAAAAAARAQIVEVKKVRKPSLALKTPVGKRAITVMIDSLQAVGGLLNAGDFVDVIAQLNVPAQDADKKTVTAMIFQSLQVLAVNTNVDDPGAYDEQQAAPSLKVTFAVDPQEAGLLTFASRNGTLQLALRSPDESQRPMVKASTWKTLADYVLKNQGFDIEDPDGENANNKPEESKPSIQIFRGGKEL
jgi:Flp pilus assembly protein CpaB